jgi:amino acid adenylation domain-containing protein/thioester reductase-like protein
MIAGQAARRPGATAVIAADARLTYRELDQAANRLARSLTELGAGPEALIGVCLERGAETVRSLLAIMKAGCGYLPLDPSLPPARLARICEQTRPLAVLTAGTRISGVRLLVPGELTGLAGPPTTAPEVSLRPDHLAYVIHTSGSTGQPKAVAVSHGSLACVIGEVSAAYRIGGRDRVLQLASLAFDTSVEQILVALTRGATVMLPPAGTLAPADLLRYLEQEHVTVADLTPAYWHELLAAAEPGDRRLRRLRLMITGGDMADPADCRAALAAAPGARLLNAYGLTETTITSTLFDVSAHPQALDADGPVPVGRPAGHARIMVLDEKQEPVPAGTTGEIYIGGCGVARGYLGEPALTVARFRPDPRGGSTEMIYRTGDLGRWRADGELELTGRADRQLKVLGYRVEPAEIESALASHPDIGQVTVVPAGPGPGRTDPGGTGLAAHYTLRHPGRPGPTAASLRRFLRARLPGYMVPAVFVAREEVTPDPGQKAPPPPRVPPRRDPGDVEDRSSTEAGLSHLWARLLKTERVGLDDDFFALGGNSLMAAEMLAHARVMFGIGPDRVGPLTRDLLRDPTLRGFARATDRARAGGVNEKAAGIDFAQEAEIGRWDGGNGTRSVGIGRDAGQDRQPPREVLLTGPTGFLGTHLLSDLLAATGARVWCLVRARDAAHARQRIAEAAARYELPAPAADRVMPLPGDLASPGLGLSPGQFRELARGTDVIYHAGALVNFIYPYSELRAANVTGTREVIRLAGLARGIPVHYVSTTAVLAGLGVAGVREVTEDTPLAHPGRLRIGYVETKYVAEELLRNAARAGLPVAIYRPLDIAGSLRTGAWNTATEICALIRFITDTGLAPDIDLPLDFVPADLCAAAIRHISLSAVPAGGSGPAGGTYHLGSPRPAGLDSLAGRLRAHGYGVRGVPFDAWVSELIRYAADHPSHPMTPFLPLFVDRDPGSGITPAEMYLGHVFPRYGRSRTEQALAGSGIDFPPVDDHLLDRTIGRLIATGYLTAPPMAARALPGLGVARDRLAWSGRCRRPPGRVLRGPEPGERARGVPARPVSDARAGRAVPHHQRGPVRGPGGGRDDRPRRLRGRRPVLGGVVVARSAAGDRRCPRGPERAEAAAPPRFADDRQRRVRPGRRGVPRGARAALADRPAAGHPDRAARLGLGAQHRGVAGRRAGRGGHRHRHRRRDQRGFPVRPASWRGRDRGRRHGRAAGGGGRPAHRRPVGQPVPAVAGRRTDAALSLPAVAGGLPVADRLAR